jgi:2-dehydro-3-deoxygluconokinase
MGRIVCFGEMLVRLSAPAPELLLQSPRLDVCFGGAEANVAVSLARFGHAARMASVVPENALGRASIAELRRWGVDVGTVSVTPGGRMGLYFLTPGMASRPPDILYDRAGSSFAAADWAGTDWRALLADAEWLHVSGVTPALGQAPADGVLALVRAARAEGVKVSFDCNYRAKLWAGWDGDGPAILRALMAEADLVFGDHRDVALILGGRYDDESALDRRRRAADAAFSAFPNLKRMASTQRVERSVNDQDIAGFLLTREESYATPYATLSPIVDRIGGGDAFAAGILDGIMSGAGDAETLRFALAAAVLKHTIPGDFNLATRTDVTLAMADGGLAVRR